MPTLKDHFRRFEEEYFEKGIGYDGYEVVDADYRADKLIETMRLKPGDSVLDVGCAYGLIVKALRERGMRAWGVDVSAWAGKKDRSGHYIRASAHALPFRDAAFDCIYSQGTLEHVPEEVIDTTLSEFRRVGRRGYLSITFSLVEATPIAPPAASCMEVIEDSLCGRPASWSIRHSVGGASLLCEAHKRKLDEILDMAERDPTHTCMHTIQWWLEKDLPPSFLLIEKPPHEVEDVYGLSNTRPFQGGKGE